MLQVYLQVLSKVHYMEKIKSEHARRSFIISWRNEWNYAKGMESLMQAICISILFLYLVMAAQFESFIDPISIMFALPLAMIGAVLGLFVFGSQLSMMHNRYYNAYGTSF